MAHLSEGYYLALYQQVKAVERRKGRTAISGAIFGVLLDYAMDYTVQAQRIDVADDIISGDAMYSETMKRLAAMDTAQGAYYGIRDVIDNMRVIASSGRPIDPRLQFEPVADAQGMILCAQAALEEECYDEAHKDFKQLYQRGPSHGSGGLRPGQNQTGGFRLWRQPGRTIQWHRGGDQDMFMAEKVLMQRR